MNNKKMGDFLKSLREEKNVSQYKIAEDLHIDRTAITKWENGKTTPSVEMLLSLSKYYDVSVDELLYGEKISENNKEAIAKNTLNVYHKQIKFKKIVRILISILLLILIIFLGYFFFSTFNSVSIYTMNTDSKSMEMNKSFFIKARDRVFFQFNPTILNEEKLNSLSIYYTDKDNKKKIIINTSSKNGILLMDYLGYEEYFNFNEINQMINNLYVDLIYVDKIETVKLDLQKEYANTNILLNTYANVDDKKNESKSSILNLNNNELENVICKDDNCIDKFNYNKENYEIYFVKDIDEITISSSSVEYIYNDVYKTFNYSHKNNLVTDYMYETKNKKCKNGNCDNFKKDFENFQKLLDYYLKSNGA